jgi:hypothetical protein
MQHFFSSIYELALNPFNFFAPRAILQTILHTTAHKSSLKCTKKDGRIKLILNFTSLTWAHALGDKKQHPIFCIARLLSLFATFFINLHSSALSALEDHFPAPQRCWPCAKTVSLRALGTFFHCTHTSERVVTLRFTICISRAQEHLVSYS